MQAGERGAEGIPGLRLVLGRGHYAGNRAELDVVLFESPPNSALPSGRDEPAGTMTVEFSACNFATIEYRLPALGIAGAIEIVRQVSPDERGCGGL
jgi:hypothetical protein